MGATFEVGLGKKVDISSIRSLRSNFPAALTHVVDILDHAIPKKDVLLRYMDDINRFRISSKR